MQTFGNKKHFIKSITGMKMPVSLLFVLIFTLLISACSSGVGELVVSLPTDTTRQAMEVTRIASEIRLLELQMTASAIPPAPTQGKEISTPGVNPLTTPTSISSGPGIVEPPIATPAPTSEGILFFEDFSNNNKGWNLRSDSSGVVRLSKNRLLVSAYAKQVIWIKVPEFNVGDEFYIEAQMTYVEGNINFGWMGWALGDPNGTNHRFLAHAYKGVAYYNNSQNILTTDDVTFYDHGTPVQIGLELLNGNATLYVNNNPKDTFPIQPYGDTIGIFLWNRTAAYMAGPTQTVAIDDIIIRESR